MHLLLVEDHPKVARFILQGLQEQGYQTDHIARGDQVLAAVTTCPYDLIILDLMLPGLDGFSIISGIREQKIDTPILVLTARDEVEDRVCGLDLGADDYMVKPFSFDELSARVRALLRRSQRTGMSILKIADLQVDPVTREVSRAGKKIDLTAKEYALLEYLLQHRGKPCPQADIIRQVWNIEFETYSNLVEVYICHLRRKIDDGFRTKLIHTVRGGGYMIQTEQE
ncbi:MAG: DNA-binding response regulator [Lentisphaerae bacterium]|nr:MAG: DNA-binding response regulator [Lentisphaerota bacterium]